MIMLVPMSPEVALEVPRETAPVWGPADDRALLERCRTGDERAMQQLYTRHAGRLYALARRMTGSRADAEDVVQETFLRAWRSLEGFRGDSSVGTWLYRIALNRCRDAFARRRPTLPEVEGAAPPQAGDAMARRSLEAALGQLPEGYREVLVLHDVMELEHPEIAAILGVEVGTSKSQLHKARSKMRELLAARGQAA
jgi:RNA polymerase sigma-70 factor, ECF subfamily